MQTEELQKSPESLDKTAVAISSLCVLHCLATPLVIISFPSLGFFMDNEAVHVSLALVLVVVAAFALIRGIKIHGRREVALWGTSGLGLLFIALLLPDHSVVGWLTWEHTLSILGSLLLIWAHLSNMRFTRYAICPSLRSA